MTELDNMTQLTELDNVPPCKICAAPTQLFGKAMILSKYSAGYFRCSRCGSIQTETPFWLDEAYSSAIASMDVGIMQRNITNVEITSALLRTLFPQATTCLDFGAGHGIFVRMMRDAGFDFRWSDRYASNDYARGFEHVENNRYQLLTAFEVIEHMVDPVEELSSLLTYSDNIFVSTGIVPDSISRLDDWWYFAPVTGQHISFLSKQGLEELARRFDRHLLSNGFYHLFTREPKNATAFKLATNIRSAWVINRLSRKRSLTQSDCDLLAKKLV